MGRYEKPFILKVTDGTDEVDLVGGTDGITLKNWKPESAKYKGGGSMQDSPLADGRRIVNKQFDNVMDTFDLILSTNTVDGAVEGLNKLRRLIERAADFWIENWQDNVVYLVCQYRGETNPRYASIVKGRIPNDEFPFGQLFLKSGIRGRRRSTSEITFICEHLIWQSTIPGTGDDTAVSAVESFNGVTFGNVDLNGTRVPSSAAGEVFVGNHHKVANLTHIRKEITPGVFTELIGNIPAVILTPTVGLATYFGCQTSVTDSGPFSSLIFDITTITAATTLTALWQYFDSTGPGWVNLGPKDNTSTGANTPFNVLGINGVFWTPPPLWVTTSINGITAYWVRLTVTVVTAVTTSAIQGNRDIYTVSWAYTEFQKSEIGGVISSIMKGRFKNDSHSSSAPGIINEPTRIYVGLRRYDRGASFQSYLNASDVQNPSGISVVLGTSGTFVTNPVSPTGRAVDFAPAGSSATYEDAVTWNLDSTISQQFYGTYMALIRIARPAAYGDGDFLFKLAVEDSTLVETAAADLTDTGSAPGDTPTTIEMGTIRLPNGNIHVGNTLSNLKIILKIAPVVGATKTITIYDVIIIPTDEMAFVADDTNPGFIPTPQVFATFVTNWEINSLNPRVDIYAVALDTNNELIRFYRPISNGPFSVHEKRRQRLWFFSGLFLSGNIRLASPRTTFSMDIDKSQRYLTARGSD